MSDYVLDQGHPDERSRLQAMAREWDPGTMALVRALGIGDGHRCLDVGAGAGSIAAALAEVTGPRGRVLAVDRDIRFLDDLPAGVEVRRLDVMVDGLPQARFDLVHARLLVAHLHPHREALRRLAAAVVPGGWLLVEEVDWTCADLVVPPAQAHTAMVGALQQVMGRGGGFDATYGRRLLGDVLDLGVGADAGVGLRAGVGLTDVSACFRGTQAAASGQAWLAWQLLVERFQQDVVGAGLLTEREVADWWSLSREASNLLVGVTMFAVQARRVA